MSITKSSESYECEPAAIEDTSPSSSNDWWKSWMTGAKSKSGEVLGFLVQDLMEISSAVKSETANFINNTTSSISEGIPINNDEWSSITSSIKESVSSIISNVNQVVKLSPADEDEEAYIVQNEKMISISKFQSKLYLLSADPNTYLLDVDEKQKSQFDAWLKTVRNDEYDLLSQESLNKQFEVNSRLKENYFKLVPHDVSHTDFWNRFMFKKASLEDEEAEKNRQQKNKERLCNGLEWESETLSSHLSPSEEEQRKVLLEYELEQGRKNEKDTTEKLDLIDGNGSEVSSVVSANDRASSSDDWEKDFDLDDIGVKKN